MRAIYAGSAAAIAVAALFVWRPEPVDQADNRVRDGIAAMAGPGELSGRVAIVEIDEKSLGQFGRWPWPRDTLARVARRILDEGASVVAFDTILNSQDRPPSNDQALADALRGRPVVLGYGFRFDSGTEDPAACTMGALPGAVLGSDEAINKAFFHPVGALCNLPELTQAAAGSGFLNGAADRDGVLRTLPLAMEFGARIYGGLALEVFRTYRRAPGLRIVLGSQGASQLELGPQAIPLEGPSLMRLHFRGPGRTFPFVSVADLMRGKTRAGFLKGKIALLGNSAIGLQGAVATPLDARLADVEVQATAIDNLIQGDALRRPAGIFLWEALFSALAGIACTFLAIAMRNRWAGAIAILFLAAVWAGCVVTLSSTGLTISPLPVTVALAVGFPLATLLTSLDERREAARREQCAVDRLRESEARYRQLVEGIGDAIVQEDTQGRILFANRKFREWFGSAEGPLRNLAMPQYRQSLRARHGTFEFEAVRPDGARMWIEAIATPVDGNGAGSPIQWALRDVTARKRMEEDLIQAQKMESVGRLAGGVAHDFNNLLTVINGYCDMLMKERDLYPEQREWLTAIRDAGGRAAQLTSNLLTFSRKQPIRASVFDLNEMVAEVAGMFGAVLGEDIQLTRRLMPAPALVQIDAGRMTQVLTNLLVNARDAMPQGGTILIETVLIQTPAEAASDGLWVRLSVSDSGTGMTDEVRRHLFEPFFTTKEDKGTGLGLATVYGIVKQAGGRIEVHSRVGEGSTFHLFFPAAEPIPVPAAVAQPKVAAKRGGGVILAVEDQEAVRIFACEVLRSAGYTVLEAASGPDALNVAARPSTGRIDLLLTDLVMPRGMTGADLAARLAESRPGIRVLFTSGYSEQVIGERGIVASGLAFLPKPFAADELLEKVREAMEGSGGQASSARV
jgi:PAS domain S-box-containing protein